jgi:hypothetical protein
MCALMNFVGHRDLCQGVSDKAKAFCGAFVGVVSQGISVQNSDGAMHLNSAGTYSNATGATSHDTCTACPANATTPSAGAMYNFECSCDLGFTGTPDSCTLCEAGKYKDTVGSASCARCPVGAYLDTPGGTSVNECIACPADATSSSGSSALSECRCNAGYTGSNGGTCTPCSVAEYKEYVGNQGCEPCPQGTYGNTTHATACISCPDQNQDSPPGSNSSLDCKCRDGYNGPNGGTCVACAAGKYWVYGDLEGMCMNCAWGKYHNEEAVVGDLCYECPPNSNTTDEASNAITDCTCSPGFRGADGSACVACPAGTYTSPSGSGSCILCDANFYSEELNATLSSMCQACDANAQSLAGSSAAEACTCNAGWTGPDGGTCHVCTAGKYKPTRGPYSCFSCQPGKYSAATGATAESTCNDCKANSHSAEGASAAGDCTCNSGYTLAQNDNRSCVECAIGKYKGEQGDQVCMLFNECVYVYAHTHTHTNIKVYHILERIDYPTWCARSAQFRGPAYNDN